MKKYIIPRSEIIQTSLKYCVNVAMSEDQSKGRKNVFNDDDDANDGW